MDRLLRLLLVEDSENDALLLFRELRRAGFELEAERVETDGALRRALQQKQWDIVISDFALPAFDGVRALRIVQELSLDLPFIIVSGTIGEDVAVDAMRAGAHDYVMKDRLARLGPAVERELREAAERRGRRLAEDAYRSLVEGSLQGFLIIQDGRIAYANQAVAEMLGYTVAEIESMSEEGVAEAVHPEDRALVWSRYADRLAGKVVPPRYQFRMLRKGGDVCWVEMFASSISFGGRPAAQAAIVDVSERVAHEREQRVIATVATSLRVAESRTDLVGILLDQVLTLLEAEGVALAMCESATGDVVFEMARGVWAGVVGGRIAAGGGLSGAILSSREPYLNNDVADDSRLVRTEILSETRAVAGVPLIAADATIGVLWIGRRRDITSDDLVLMGAIAEMTASAVRRIVLHEELERSNEELTRAYDSTLLGWGLALELRDADTEGHTRRVADLAVRLGQAVGLEDEDLVHLRRGALLHDIGKMAIPDHILRKPGALNEAEWVIMRQHPVFAYEMLTQISYLRPAVEIPYCHHERWDGKGYPRGLAGEAIPMAARVFAVVDVWDAMRSDRPYRAAWKEEKTVNHIREGSGSHFDPQMVQAFLEIVHGG